MVSSVCVCEEVLRKELSMGQEIRNIVTNLVLVDYRREMKLK